VFDEGEFSGILGLAFPSGAAFDQIPLFDNIMNQGLIGYNLFAFYYSINELEDAEISFGAVNPDRFSGDII